MFGYYALDGGGRMDFIERLFGVSPDGGDGSLEFIYFLSIAAAMMLGALMWRRLRSPH